MSQTTELARVKARIKALSEKTVGRGCTEAEALAAAEMVGRLLERYALTMEEIDVRQQPCVQVAVSLRGQRRRPIDGCVPAIARFCDCKVWLARTEGHASYMFFGFDSDTALAVYLFGVIERAMQWELALFRESHPTLAGVTLRRASANFQHGMAARVAERLETMHGEREAAVAARRTCGRALILLRHQIVATALRDSRVRLRSTPGLAYRRDAAFRAGRSAGERVNLSRPVGHSDEKLLA